MRPHGPAAFVVTAAVAALVAATPAAAQRTPHDPLLGEQWAMSPQAIADLPAAWRHSQGAGVVVAVIDTGANLQHADLAPSIWTNFRERPGNGADDDGNGYVDDVHGVDLTAGPHDNTPEDGQGHGTHVAGIIAGAANNRGIVGVAYRAKLMIIKVIGNDGSGRSSAVAEGIRYAAANGARIINLSLGGRTKDEDLEAAVAEAAAANALVVAAAGNDGTDNDARPVYPAAIAAPNLVAVAATAPTQGRELATVSNFGRHTVSLAAPGEQIVSASRTGRYEVRTGTSMATPHVAGVAALMASVRRDLPVEQLRAQILQSASRSALPVSAGYLDADAAVRSVGTATHYDLGQRPLLRVLDPTATARELSLQIAASGAVEAVARFRITLGRRRVADVRPAAFPLAVRVRVAKAAGRHVRVSALDRRGRTLASASARVAKAATSKPDTSSGPAIGTQG